MHQELENAFSLKGRVAVITGAGRGIGRQAAITFAQAGAKVVITDVLRDELAETAGLVEAVSVPPMVKAVDVTNRDQMFELAASVVETHGRLDIWANVAGIIRYASIVDVTMDDLQAIIAVNQIGVHNGISAAGKHMPDGGSIINIASGGGDVPAPTLSVYGMTKAAVMHLTKTAAMELGGQGIRVNAIAPGFIDTPMVQPYWTAADGTVDDDARKRTLDARASISPLKLTGVTTDITYAMLYLAADASRFMTGQVLRPNGGVFMA